MNDHDYNQNPEPAHSGMETAAIILGILALIGSTCFYLSIPCAAIGILLALLSRGRREHMSTIIILMFTDNIYTTRCKKNMYVL